MKKLEQVLEDWEAVIGLEIHAELTTLETKMFCSCKLEFGAEPNTHTCPVCLGLPGALPVPNKAAIESIVLAGLATNCDIEKRSMFYRKNYMYPDMAKNFQTTQGPVAFCMRGHLDLDVDGAAAKERIDLADLKPGEQGAEGTTAANVTRTEDGYVAQARSSYARRGSSVYAEASPDLSGHWHFRLLDGRRLAALRRQRFPASPWLY